MSIEVPDDNIEYSHIIGDIAKQGRCQRAIVKSDTIISSVPANPGISHEK